ncbi:MAG: endonuclease/exonuclease/phosphatase family protein [Balneolaceae bacterium]|nr:endonuclease/exonuclease/phosphatase family protein [Balneolaceae bacterium]
MIYNIHHGEGIDGKTDLNRIASVINKENPDILLLQEVDVNLERSQKIDIPTYLSDKTALSYSVFGKNIDIENGAYGNATLSRFPISTSENFQFEKIGPEQRGILATEISIDGNNLLVLNTHLDHTEGDSERFLYAEKAQNEILPLYGADTVLFGGDFNDIPTSRMYQKLLEEFKDAWVVSGNKNGYTIPANDPSKRIDYIFFKGDIKPDSTWIPKTEASDHLPVVSDFVWIDDE